MRFFFEPAPLELTLISGRVIISQNTVDKLTFYQVDIYDHLAKKVTFVNFLSVAARCIFSSKVNMNEVLYEHSFPEKIISSTLISAADKDHFQFFQLK